jgi:diguanylate cyclase (GGDEF)-like protein/PAS domain S-box-containing protein
VSRVTIGRVPVGDARTVGIDQGEMVAIRRLFAAYGAVCAVLVTLVFALPGLHPYLWTAMGATGATAVVYGALRNRPRRRAPWFVVAAGLFCFALGDLTADLLVDVFHEPDPFPSLADVFYLLFYALVAIGIGWLYSLGVVRRSMSSLLDALTLTVGVGLLAWIYLINPYVQNPDMTPFDKAVAIAYPLADVVLLAVGARLFASVRRTPSTLLLAAGGIGLLVADVCYGLIQLNGEWQVGGPVDLGWVAVYLLWGAAALHPSMRSLTEPKVIREGRDNSRRLLPLGLASLIAPTVLLVEVLRHRVTDGVVIALSSAVLALLVLVRLSGAIGVHRRVVERERRLREAGGRLLTANDPDEVAAVVTAAVAGLLPGHPHRAVVASADLDGFSMRLTSTLDPTIAAALGDFEVTLCAPLAADNQRSGRVGVLFVAAAEPTLVPLQEAALVLATQAALALDRIALSSEIDRRNSEAYFRTLVLNTADVILIVDEADRITYASPSAQTLFRVPVLDGVDVAELVTDDTVDDIRMRLHAARIGDADRHERDWRILRPGDRYALVEASVRDLRNEATVAGLVITLRDVTERSRLEAELFHRATFDALTGLPNREVFLAGVQEAVELGAATGATVGVLIVELDDFKVVNDTMGHIAGDELLVAVGERLSRALSSSRPDIGGPKPDGSVARLGGDEFAAVVKHARGVADVEEVAERILSVFATPFELSHGSVTAGASVGIATMADATDAQELLRHADLAVYVAKDAGKGRWRRYEESLHNEVVERLKLRSDLDRAVAEEAFLLHYQPIVRLGSGQTLGFEALVRWNHPTRGMVPPMQFIDLAEESGLIVPLGSWVLRNAMDAAMQWRLLRPLESTYVSVNVSPRQLRTPGFADQVRVELARTGLPPRCLMLEMTESLLLHDDGQVADELQSLRKDGVRIAIDDFGTGFSSLSYLRRLPVDVLKLDKSFIDTVAASQEQFAVVDAIIQLAGILRLQVVAEGIETSAEHDLLVGMGCELGQGYLFSRPVSYGDASQWLLEDATRLLSGRRTVA